VSPPGRVSRRVKALDDLSGAATFSIERVAQSSEGRPRDPQKGEGVLDVLVNNAGVWLNASVVGPDGIERTWATIGFERRPYDGQAAYAQSKQADRASTDERASRDSTALDIHLGATARRP
jgi:hypothetical protein